MSKVGGFSQLERPKGHLSEEHIYSQPYIHWLFDDQ